MERVYYNDKGYFVWWRPLALRRPETQIAVLAGNNQSRHRRSGARKCKGPTTQLAVWKTMSCRIMQAQPRKRDDRAQPPAQQVDVEVPPSQSHTLQANHGDYERLVHSVFDTIIACAALPDFARPRSLSHGVDRSSATGGQDEDAEAEDRNGSSVADPKFELMQKHQQNLQRRQEEEQVDATSTIKRKPKRKLSPIRWSEALFPVQLPSTDARSYWYRFQDKNESRFEDHMDRHPPCTARSVDFQPEEEEKKALLENKKEVPASVAEKCCNFVDDAAAKDVDAIANTLKKPDPVPWWRSTWFLVVSGCLAVLSLGVSITVAVLKPWLAADVEIVPPGETPPTVPIRRSGGSQGGGAAAAAGAVFLNRNVRVIEAVNPQESQWRWMFEVLFQEAPEAAEKQLGAYFGQGKHQIEIGFSSNKKREEVNLNRNTASIHGAADGSGRSSTTYSYSSTQQEQDVLSLSRQSSAGDTSEHVPDVVSPGGPVTDSSQSNDRAYVLTETWLRKKVFPFPEQVRRLALKIYEGIIVTSPQGHDPAPAPSSNIAEPGPSSRTSSTTPDTDEEQFFVSRSRCLEELQAPRSNTSAGGGRTSTSNSSTADKIRNQVTLLEPAFLPKEAEFWSSVDRSSRPPPGVLLMSSSLDYTRASRARFVKHLLRTTLTSTVSTSSQPRIISSTSASASSQPDQEDTDLSSLELVLAANYLHMRDTVRFIHSLDPQRLVKLFFYYMGCPGTLVRPTIVASAASAPDDASRPRDESSVPRVQKHVTVLDRAADQQRGALRRQFYQATKQRPSMSLIDFFASYHKLVTATPCLSMTTGVVVPRRLSSQPTAAPAAGPQPRSAATPPPPNPANSTSQGATGLSASAAAVSSTLPHVHLGGPLGGSSSSSGHNLTSLSSEPAQSPHLPGLSTAPSPHSGMVPVQPPLLHAPPPASGPVQPPTQEGPPSAATDGAIASWLPSVAGATTTTTASREALPQVYAGPDDPDDEDPAARTSTLATATAFGLTTQNYRLTQPDEHEAHNATTTPAAPVAENTSRPGPGDGGVVVLSTSNARTSPEPTARRVSFALPDAPTITGAVDESGRLALAGAGTGSVSLAVTGTTGEQAERRSAESRELQTRSAFLVQSPGLLTHGAPPLISPGPPGSRTAIPVAANLLDTTEDNSTLLEGNHAPAWFVDAELIPAMNPQHSVWSAMLWTLILRSPDLSLPALRRHTLAAAAERGREIDSPLLIGGSGQNEREFSCFFRGVILKQPSRVHTLVKHIYKKITEHAVLRRALSSARVQCLAEVQDNLHEDHPHTARTTSRRSRTTGTESRTSRGREQHEEGTSNGSFRLVEPALLPSIVDLFGRSSSPGSSTYNDGTVKELLEKFYRDGSVWQGFPACESAKAAQRTALHVIEVVSNHE
ncbi:unnamed protein product [Amoebophrya sp. A120]|nr:unnamed protein product [Amoebophrya sp. A120]|eukprot:GSA120T00018066001.1